MALAAEASDGGLLGVAALEDSESADFPGAGPRLLLHGLYVKPGAMGSGVGRRLLEASAGIAGALGCAELLVKAVRESRGFFERCGWQALSAESASDYPYRYSLPISARHASSGEGHGARRVPVSVAAGNS